MTALLRFTGGLLDRLLAVVLAVTAAQVPLYYAQYLQTLAGVRLEAQARYLELQGEAASLQLSIEDFVRRHENNADTVFQASGRIHRSTLERFQRFDGAYRALSTAGAWEKPQRLAEHFDADIDSAVRFTPGLPLNSEGLAWAGAGLLLAWLCTGLLGALFGPGRRRSALSL